MSQPPHHPPHSASQQHPPTAMASALRNNLYSSNYQILDPFIQQSRQNISTALPFSDTQVDLTLYHHQQQQSQHPRTQQQQQQQYQQHQQHQLHQQHHHQQQQQQLLYQHQPDLRHTSIPWSQQLPITSSRIPAPPPPPPPPPPPQPSLSLSQQLPPDPSIYQQHQQPPTKRHRPSSSQPGPSDKRIGKDRVERPCSKCGTMNHIRKNKCSNCAAPKDPPKKRTRRRRRFHPTTPSPSQLQPPHNPSQPNDPLFDPAYVPQFDPHDVATTTTTSSSRH